MPVCRFAAATAVRAVPSRVRCALRHYAATAPMQAVPDAVRHVRARRGRNWHEARRAAQQYAAPPYHAVQPHAVRHVRRSSVRALRNAVPLPCGARVQRNAGQVQPYVVLRNAGLVPPCVGPPLPDAAPVRHRGGPAALGPVC